MKLLVLPALSVLIGLAGCGTQTAEPSRRVFLIGLDGATWDLVDPLLAAGKMPHLAALIAEGSRAPLRSMIPTKSPALWTTIATGKEFDGHGINDFTDVTFEDGTMNMKVMHMTSNMRTTKALWNIVDADAGRSAFVGWWVSYPAEEVDGFVVSSRVPLSQSGGKGAPTKGVLTADGVGAQTWPRELYGEILPLIRPAESVTFDEAARFMDLAAEELERDIVEGFRWAYAADETYAAVAEHLMDRDPDMALWGLYFNGIDVVSHRYWQYLEPSRYPDVSPTELPRFRKVIERYYEYTDGLLGRILERRRPGDTFVLVSDHGFHAYGHKDGPAGLLVVAGENIAGGVSPAEVELADLAPTVLALLGLPAAKDMDGRVVDELFTPAWREAYPDRRVNTYDTPEWLARRDRTPVPSDADEELMERLEALGYLD